MTARTPIHCTLLPHRGGVWAAVAAIALHGLTMNLRAQGPLPVHLPKAPDSVKPDPGLAALAAAAFRGDAEAVKEIMVKGTNPDASYGSDTPLQIASERGHDQVVAFLLKQGARINAVDSMGDTPLSAAAANGHAKVVRILLDYGAELNHQNLDGWTPFWWAVTCGRTEMVKMLIEAGADLKPHDEDLQPSFAYAARFANLPLLKLLLEKGLDPAEKTKYGYSAFAAAAAAGSIDALRLLSDHTKAGAAQKDLLSDALHWAVNSGRMEVIRFLVDEKKVDINRQIENNIGHYAYGGGSGKEEFTPLSRAVALGNEEIIYFLLERGARIEGRTFPGYPILSEAIRRKRDDWVQLFLSKKAPVNAVDYSGRTALMLSSEAGAIKLTKQLLAHGATAAIQDSDGRTALHFAAMKGRSPIVSLLLAAGASPMATDGGGKTPREYAAMEGYVETAELLEKAEKEAVKKTDVK